MPYISVDIDLGDIYDDMTNSDKRDMVEWLERDGFCNFPEDECECEDDFQIVDPNLLDDIWIEIVKKLFNGRLQLSLEDEEIITKISNKL